jgi:hypothetical protein
MCGQLGKPEGQSPDGRGRRDGPRFLLLSPGWWVVFPARQRVTTTPEKINSLPPADPRLGLVITGATVWGALWFVPNHGIQVVESRQQNGVTVHG